jgi:hypothetical protein
MGQTCGRQASAFPPPTVPGKSLFDGVLGWFVLFSIHVLIPGSGSRATDGARSGARYLPKLAVAIRRKGLLHRFPLLVGWSISEKPKRRLPAEIAENSQKSRYCKWQIPRKILAFTNAKLNLPEYQCHYSKQNHQHGPLFLANTVLQFNIRFRLPQSHRLHPGFRYMRPNRDREVLSANGKKRQPQFWQSVFTGT